MKKPILNIVITGGSSGIGRAIALEMASSNHNFFLIGRNQENLTQVSSILQSQKCNAFIGIGDVSVPTEVDRLYNDALTRLGRIDVLVANAGVGYFGLLEEMTLSQYNAQFDTNVKGVFLWLRKVLPHMKERNSGQILVTSSNLGVNTSARASIYAATKHAVQAMIGCLRKELEGTLVKAATLNPGSVDTPWFDGKAVDRTKMLAAEDVAKAARLIIEQASTSNIHQILLSPGKM